MDGHIFLHVQDLESAKRFYVDILGMQLDRERTEWIDLKPTRLGLSVSKGGERLIEKVGYGRDAAPKSQFSTVARET